jgi:hypothetical protein
MTKARSVLVAGEQDCEDGFFSPIAIGGVFVGAPEWDGTQEWGDDTAPIAPWRQSSPVHEVITYNRNFFSDDIPVAQSFHPAIEREVSISQWSNRYISLTGAADFLIYPNRVGKRLSPSLDITLEAFQPSSDNDKPITTIGDALELLSRFDGKINPDTIKAIASRIEFILENSDEDDDQCTCIDSGALQRFLHVMTMQPAARCPAIFAASGALEITWRKDANNVLSIIFQPGDEISIFAHRWNDTHPEKIEKIRASATMDRITTYLTLFGPLEWMTT